MKADSPARSFTSFIYQGTRDLSFTRVIRLEAQCCLRKRTKCRVCPQSSISPPLLVSSPSFSFISHVTAHPYSYTPREFTYNQARSFRDNVVGTDGRTVCANASPSALSRIYCVGLPSATASPYPLKIKAGITAGNKRGASGRIPNGSVQSTSVCTSRARASRAASMRGRTSACRGIPPETMADVRKRIRRRFCLPDRIYTSAVMADCADHSSRQVLAKPIARGMLNAKSCSLSLFRKQISALPNLLTV